MSTYKQKLLGGALQHAFTSRIYLKGIKPTLMSCVIIKKKIKNKQPNKPFAMI